MQQKQSRNTEKNLKAK